MIFDRLVSEPTRVARKSNEPVRLMVAAYTVSPTVFSCGMDSPVRALSSTAVDPSTTTPSTGMDSPGLTRKIWPTWMSVASTMLSLPSGLTRWACLGARSISPSMALPVFDLLRHSKYLPTVTSVRMVPALSKYRLSMAVIMAMCTWARASWSAMTKSA